MYSVKYPEFKKPFLKIERHHCLLSILIFLTFYSSTAIAQGNVLITPKRLIFDGTKRSEEVNLVNVGKDTAIYTISFVQYRMKEDGAFEQISQPDSGQNFSSNNLRVYPRTIRLSPGQPQTIKVQVNRSNELSTGEYRSHLYFRAEPDTKPLGEKVNPVKDSGVSIKITPVFGISIPIIIRSGENTSRIALSGLSFMMENDSIPTVRMTINRDGNMSVYGEILIDHLSPQGKTTRVGTINGLSVYTPSLLRNVKVTLDKKAAVDYKSGSLHIVFSDPLTKRLAQHQIYLH